MYKECSEPIKVKNTALDLKSLRGTKKSGDLPMRWNGKWNLNQILIVFQFCPSGQRIFGAKVKQEPNQGSGDDTATNGIIFLCQ